MTEEYFLVVMTGDHRLVVGARGRRVACATGPIDDVLSDRPQRRALEGWRTVRGALDELSKVPYPSHFGVEITPYARRRGDWSVEVYLRTGDKLIPYHPTAK